MNMSTLPKTLHWRGRLGVSVSLFSAGILVFAALFFPERSFSNTPAPQSVYRSADTSTFHLSLCNPNSSASPVDPGFVPAGPRGPNAVCLDVDTNGTPLRLYFYDSNGALLRMERFSDGSDEFVATYFVNRKPKFIQDFRQGSSETQFFYTATGEKVAAVENGSSQDLEFDSLVRFSNSSPIYRYNGDVETEETQGLWRFFVKDHVENPILEVSSDGALTRKDYLPYGQVFYVSNEANGSETFFNGKRRDSNLLDFHARHYDPQTEKFLQPDTELPDGLRPLGYNRYLFTYGNPVAYSDPSGEFPVLAAILIGAALSVATNGDNIDDFSDFATFAMAGGLAGLAPGLGNALGGTAISYMVAGGATNVASLAVASTAFPGVLSGDAFMASALAGAASGAVIGQFSSLPDGVTEIGKGDQILLSGFSGAARSGANGFIYSSFGYGSSNGALAMASSFFSGATQVATAKLPGGPLMGVGIGLGSALIATGGNLDSKTMGTSILSSSLLTLLHVTSQGGRADQVDKGPYADFPKDPKEQSRWYGQRALNEAWKQRTGMSNPETQTHNGHLQFNISTRGTNQ